jgi:hypothetical protein
MATTTTVFACTIKHSSPTSVVHNEPHHVVEHLILPQQQEQQQKSEQWVVCPSSAKSQRTINPIRAFIDPIASNIKLGYQRADGKNPISLAVCCRHVACKLSLCLR